MPRSSTASVATASGCRTRSRVRSDRRRHRSSNSGRMTSSGPRSASTGSSVRTRARRSSRKRMARRKPPTIHGMAVIDKPAGVTSHDVVNMLRRHFGEKRIGHAGTLDPGATGVLVVAVGNATRLLQFVSGADKSYVGEIVLGSTTTTLDNEGEVTAVFDMSDVTLEQARVVAADHLTGDILQVPPMVSALKVDGRRLHELAREGVEIDREARPVTVSRFDLEATDDPM